jgi:hypothetical protein
MIFGVATSVAVAILPICVSGAQMVAFRFGPNPPAPPSKF